MSLSSTRPRVRHVSGAAATAALAAGAVGIGSVVRAFVEALSQSETAALKRQMTSSVTAEPRVSVIASPSIVATQCTLTAPSVAIGIADSHRPTLESLRVSTLTVLASSPAVVEVSDVAGPLRRFMEASTVDDAEVARRGLYDAMQSSHRQFFTRSLAAACAEASREVGLQHVDTSTTPDGTVRIVATSDGGRALVTEIAPTGDGDVSVASEVIGGDGRCAELMDRYDRAVERLGVVSDAPTRRDTGGVCDLAVARAFVARRAIRRLTSAGSTKTTVQPRRPSPTRVRQVRQK